MGDDTLPVAVHAHLLLFRTLSEDRHAAVGVPHWETGPVTRVVTAGVLLSLAHGLRSSCALESVLGKFVKNLWNCPVLGRGSVPSVPDKRLYPVVSVPGHVHLGLNFMFYLADVDSLQRRTTGCQIRQEQLCRRRQPFLFYHLSDYFTSPVAHSCPWTSRRLSCPPPSFRLLSGQWTCPGEYWPTS